MGGVKAVEGSGNIFNRQRPAHKNCCAVLQSITRTWLKHPTSPFYLILDFHWFVPSPPIVRPGVALWMAIPVSQSSALVQTEICSQLLDGTTSVCPRRRSLWRCLMCSPDPGIIPSTRFHFCQAFMVPWWCVIMALWCLFFLKFEVRRELFQNTSSCCTLSCDGSNGVHPGQVASLLKSQHWETFYTPSLACLWAGEVNHST